MSVRLRELWRDQRGATAVEFAMVGIPFFMFIMAILEIGLVFFAGTILDHATHESARLVRTGQAQNSGMDAGTFKQKICENMTSVICSDASRLHVEVLNFDSFSEAASGTTSVIDPATGEVNTGFQFNTGARNEIVVVRAVYEWPMISNWIRDAFQDTADGDRLLVSTSVFKNEPF
ncbi:TadE/TadG family type IV pilus assembly protein [Pseudovibrio flavus]|uniref:TadE/TadG family type IV pilus assembly protein n=1 Tax=Pseudovibrio flavus TaxID=2529854 RepID=UPI0035275827